MALKRSNKVGSKIVVSRVRVRSIWSSQIWQSWPIVEVSSNVKTLRAQLTTVS